MFSSGLHPPDASSTPLCQCDNPKCPQNCHKSLAMGCKISLLACKELQGSKAGKGETSEGEEGAVTVQPERLVVGGEVGGSLIF